MAVWSAEECRTFLASIADYPQPFRALYRFLIDTGCRPSEAYAVKWTDYDTSSGYIKIIRSLERSKTKSGVMIKETKTPKGRRSILLSKSTRQELTSLPRKNDYIFSSADGGFLQHNYVMRRFQRILKRIGIRRIRFYDLRHTSASLLLQAGINLKVISDRLGHQDSSITLRTYAHVLPTMQAAEAEKLWGQS